MKGKGRETRELMTKVRITAVLKRLCGSLHEWTRNMSEHSPSSVRYTRRNTRSAQQQRLVLTLTHTHRHTRLHTHCLYMQDLVVDSIGELDHGPARLDHLQTGKHLLARETIHSLLCKSYSQTHTVCFIVRCERK